MELAITPPNNAAFKFEVVVDFPIPPFPSSKLPGGVKKDEGNR
jgi:hypothetical protein